MVIIGGQARRIAGELGDRGRKSERVTIPTRRSPRSTGRRLTLLDSMICDDLVERGILGDGEGIRRHDLADLAAMGMHEVGGDPVVPTRKLSQRPRFRSVPISARRMKSPSEMMPISLPRIDHRQSADVVPQHRVDGLGDGGIGAHRNDVLGHDLVARALMVSGSDTC